MKISFIIPAYNEELIIGDCLTSLQKALAEHPEVVAEVIVVNNASTDTTKEVAESFVGVRVVTENRKGLVWARQAGFEASIGDLIANIDSDTVIPAKWLGRLVHEFSKDESLIALSGPQIYYDMPWYVRAVIKFWYGIGFVSNSVSGFFSGTKSLFQGGNFVIRRHALEQIGGYDTRIQFYGEDTDTGRRLSAVGKIKWTFAFPIYASGRRIMKNGILKTGYLYAMTYIWVTFLGKPFTQTYDDVRLKKER